MKRIYLDKNGLERFPTRDENSHYGMAHTILGKAWNGNADDAYEAMWKLGWVRVVEDGKKIFAEKYLDGKPVPIANLPRAQRNWLEDKKLEGFEIVWNDVLFVESREKTPKRRV